MIPLVLADPLTLTAIGTGVSALIGGGSLINSIVNAPKAPTAPSAPPPAQSPNGTPNTNKGNAPSFLSSAAAAPGQESQGGKTLLGQ